MKVPRPPIVFRSLAHREPGKSCPSKKSRGRCICLGPSCVAHRSPVKILIFRTAVLVFALRVAAATSSFI